MNPKPLFVTLLPVVAALLMQAAHAEDATNNVAPGRTDDRKVSNDRNVIVRDPPGRNYQRPMTPSQRQQQLAYERSRNCYARYTVKGGGLRPGAEKACGPALKDPSASQ